MDEIDQAYTEIMAQLEAEYSGGDGAAMIHILYYASQFQKPPPQWVQMELFKAYERVNTSESESLEQALGGFAFKPYFSPRKMQQVQLHGVPLIARVYDFVCRRNQDIAMMEAFADAADHFHIPEGTVKDWYYEYKKHSEAQ